MKIQSIDEYREKQIELGFIHLTPDPNLPEHIARRYIIEGCTAEEVEEIIAAQGVNFLPEIYRQFLLQMGRHAGTSYQGSDATYPVLLDLKNQAEDLLSYDRASDFQLPEDAFVFFMHHGYQFLFFHTKGKDDNPAVYGYVEGKGAKKLRDSLLEHYGTTLDELTKLRDAKKEHEEWLRLGMIKAEKARLERLRKRGDLPDE